ncbi:hypothetical protein U1Q18_048006 [Sarracenia purpurea var. burkii]
MEVPIIGSDSVKWHELSATSTSPSSTSAAANGTLALPPPCSALPTKDAASCSIIGDSPAYLIWARTVLK